MMRKTILLAVLFSLISCGENNDPPAPRPEAAAETGAAAEVAKLDEGLRNGVLEKAIKASGALCPSVTRSERAEVRPGIKGWKAQCDNGTAHLIEIQSDGTANVTSRTY